MTTATQQHFELAKTLLTHEGRVASNERAAAWRVFDKIFAELAPIIGEQGVIAVFARSAVVAKAECHALADLVITIESLEAVRAHVHTYFEKVAEANVTDCAITACAAFLALMSRLVGYDLTVQLLHRAWPDLKESK